jgi:hypothetical protein
MVAPGAPVLFRPGELCVTVPKEARSTSLVVPKDSLATEIGAPPSVAATGEYSRRLNVFAVGVVAS